MKLKFQLPLIEKKKSSSGVINAANIFANVLNPNLEKIWSAVSNDGHLVISGILNEHHKSVIETSKNNGMPTPNIHTKGKWVSFHYQKSQ